MNKIQRETKKILELAAKEVSKMPQWVRDCDRTMRKGGVRKNICYHTEKCGCRK